MKTWYNILFTCAFWLSSPYYFLKMWRRGQWREGFGQRFGHYDSKIKQALTNRHVIWLHAVSVGEVNICTQLIRALEPRVPNLKIVVSTTTSTGMAELKRRLPPHILKIYYPIDRRSYVKRAFSVLGPEAIVLVEAEIWPNFLWQAQRQRVPTFLVNARLSERSWRGYRRFGFLFRRLFASFAGVGVQSEADGLRLQELGCRPEAIRLVGNLKFDAARLDENRHLDVEAMLKHLGVPAEAPVLLGGSTHTGEEALLVDIFLRLRARVLGLFLILVPRHQERGREVGRMLEERGVRFVYRSLVLPHTPHPPGSIDCLLVNSTGELRFFYECAHAVFVGKSMTSQGGQNPIEPASLGKPIVFGPHMENFPSIVPAFLSSKAAIQVQSPAELESALAHLLTHPDEARAMGKRALEVVSKNRGSLERTVDMIIHHLSQEDVFISH